MYCELMTSVAFVTHCTWWGFCTTLLFLHFSKTAGFSFTAQYRSPYIFTPGIAIKVPIRLKWPS